MLKATLFLFATALPILVLTSEGSSCPCVNTKEINPVCASDNLTYVNPGEVKCVNQCQGKRLKIVDHKPCPCLCSNTKEYMPVCADDDNTYVNKGAVRCHNQCYYRKIQIAKNDKCREEDNGLPH